MIANDAVFRHKDQVIREQDFFFAEPSFLKIFSFKLLKGDPNTALSEPYSLLLTPAKASALFGEEDPMGYVKKLDSMFGNKKF